MGQPYSQTAYKNRPAFAIDNQYVSAIVPSVLWRLLAQLLISWLVWMSAASPLLGEHVHRDKHGIVIHHHDHSKADAQHEHGHNHNISADEHHHGDKSLHKQTSLQLKQVHFAAQQRTNLVLLFLLEKHPALQQWHKPTNADVAKQVQHPHIAILPIKPGLQSFAAQQFVLSKTSTQRPISAWALATFPRPPPV